MNVYEKLKEMNITLPAPPPKGGVYTQFRNLETICSIVPDAARILVMEPILSESLAEI